MCWMILFLWVLSDPVNLRPGLDGMINTCVFFFCFFLCRRSKGAATEDLICHQQQNTHAHAVKRILSTKMLIRNATRRKSIRRHGGPEPSAQVECRWQRMSIDCIDPCVRIHVELHGGETQQEANVKLMHSCWRTDTSESGQRSSGWVDSISDVKISTQWRSSHTNIMQQLPFIFNNSCTEQIVWLCCAQRCILYRGVQCPLWPLGGLAPKVSQSSSTDRCLQPGTNTQDFTTVTLPTWRQSAVRRRFQLPWWQVLPTSTHHTKDGLTRIKCTFSKGLEISTDLKFSWWWRAGGKKSTNLSCSHDNQLQAWPRETAAKTEEGSSLPANCL